MAEQKVKTKEYWDKFYKTNPTSIGGGDSKSTDTDVHNKQVDGDGDESNASDLEWIVPNAPQLLDKILDLFPSWPPKEGYDDIINVLEIGCGVSQISKSLLPFVKLTGVFSTLISILGPITKWKPLLGPT